jgi:hypothetical protein
LGKITPPALLNPQHEITPFNSGVSSLDEWLIKRALKNQTIGVSRTFVICENNQVIGYYALATGNVERLSAPSAIARNTPESIPVIVLGRLAIDRQYQGH